MGGNLLMVVCFSVCGALAIGAIGILLNFPRLLQGLLLAVRLLLRGSFQLYAFSLSKLRPLIYSTTGLDVLSPHARVISCTVLSLAIGCGFLVWLGWHIGFWWLAIFTAHGLLIGSVWEHIENPGEFRLGERMP
ncbi:MAG: hypothetical protein KF821_02105 [Anaerolineales bacterium]|nr:hypothetical protein [Anaerolineales bacterium]